MLAKKSFFIQDKETPITDNGRINPSDDGHKDGSHLGGGFGSPGSGFRFNSYSFSRSIRTVQKPDGTIETEERTRFVNFIHNEKKLPT